MKKINIEDLKKSILDDIDKVKVKIEENRYNEFYIYFVNYYKNISGDLNKENIVIGASFTYSWMPTILKKFKFNLLDKAIPLFNKVKSNKELTKEELNLLKELVNNSTVGVSKLLHFINPKKYPIYDSRVYYFIMNKNKYRDSVEDYLNYINILKELEKDIKFKNEISTQIKIPNFNISFFRAVELIMFTKGGKN